MTKSGVTTEIPIRPGKVYKIGSNGELPGHQVIKTTVKGASTDRFF